MGSRVAIASKSVFQTLQQLEYNRNSEVGELNSFGVSTSSRRITVVPPGS